MLYHECAAVTKILGALFYFRPSEYQQNGISQVLEFKAPEQEASDLLLQFEKVVEQFKQHDTEQLNSVHDEFFSGIADMPVPPWGSVYLDRECVLFGESTSQYKQFLTNNGFEFETHNNDPLDHIGLMLMTLGEVLESQPQDQAATEQVNELLSVHMLPWTTHYLAQIKPLVIGTPYAHAVELTVSVLKQLSNSLEITAQPRQVYFNIASQE